MHSGPFHSNVCYWIVITGVLVCSSINTAAGNDGAIFLMYCWVASEFPLVDQ